MKISKMFEVLSKNNYQEYPVVVFTYENEYPVLFFTELLQKLAKDSEIILKNISATVESQDLFETEIQTTFLGQTCSLWLGSLSNLSASEQLKIVTICGQYKGPHRIILCIAVKDLPKTFTHKTIFNIDQELTMQDKDILFSFLYPTLTYASVQKISAGIASFKSIDNLIMLAHYAMVLGRNTDVFVHDWLPKIIITFRKLMCVIAC